MIPPKDLESPVDEALLPPSPGDRIVGNTNVVQPDDLLIANIRAAPDKKVTLLPSGFENPSIYCYRNALLSVLLCSDRLMSYIQHHHLPRIYEYQHGFISKGKLHLPSDYQDVLTMMHRLFQSYWSSSRDQESVDEAMREFWEYIDSPACRFGIRERWPMKGQQDSSELINFLVSILHLQLGEHGADTSAVQFGEIQNVQHLMYSVTQILKWCAGCRLNKNVKHALKTDESLCWQVPMIAEGTLRLEDLVFQDYGKEVADSPWYCSDCSTSWEKNVKVNYVDGTRAYKNMIAKRYARSKSDYEWHSVARLPEVLLMQLKIFDHDLDKLDVQIRLLRELNMAAYVNKDVCKGSTKYRLKGVVRHIENDISFGHYTSEVVVADQWYYINDETVRKTSWLEVNNTRRQKGSSPETPYLLLWEKVPDPEDEGGSPSSGRVSSPIEISSSENSPSHSSPIEISSNERSSSRSSTRQGPASGESGGHGAGSPGSNSDGSVMDGSDNDDPEHDSPGDDVPSDDVSDNRGSDKQASDDEGSDKEGSDNNGSDEADSDSDSSDDPNPDTIPANAVFVADAGTQTLSKLHDAPAAIRSSINFDGQSLLEIHPIPNLPDLMERIYAAPEGGERPSNAIDVKHRGRLEVFQMEDGHPPVSLQLWKVLRRGYLHWEDIIDKDAFGKKQKQAWYNFYNNVHTSYGPGVHPVEMIPKWQWRQREADRRKNEYWARIAAEEKAEQEKGRGKETGTAEEPKVRKISIFQTPMIRWVPAVEKPTGKSKKPKSPPSKLKLKQPHQNAETFQTTPSPTTPRPKYTTRGTSPETPSPKTPPPGMPSPRTPRPEYKNEQTQVHPTDLDVSDDDRSSSSYVTARSPAKSKSKSPSPRQSPTGPGASSSSLSSPPHSSSSLSSPPDSPAPKPKRRVRPPKAATQPTRVMPGRKTKPEHPGLVGETVMKGPGKKTAPKKPAAGKKVVKKPGTGGRKGVGKKTPVKKVPVVSDDTGSESGTTKRSTKKRKRADVEEEGEVAKEADEGKEGEEGRGDRKRLKKNEDGTWSRA